MLKELDRNLERTCANYSGAIFQNPVIVYFYPEIKHKATAGTKQLIHHGQEIARACNGQTLFQEQGL